MELTNEFTVPLPPERAWAVLTDIERIAPHLPGAQLTEVDGDEFKGTVKVKVGPITATYKGAARFEARDDDARRAVIKAEGRDARQGSASATITATVASEGDGSKVSVVTDLTVAGKVAQFGRGVLADVSAKLIGQFVDALNHDLAAEATAAGPTDGGPPASDPPAERVVAVDLLGVAGAPVLKRVAPLAVVVVLVLLLLSRRRRSRGGD